jgi:hypothetical protein
VAVSLTGKSLPAAARSQFLLVSPKLKPRLLVGVVVVVEPKIAHLALVVVAVQLSGS